ncbi:MAG: TonB-dependent receptor, partial [bacterium]|nr:TonB-dependent receptor [bacterium]
MRVSIEELGSVERCSVARRRRKLSETAAAVYVLSSEDIRRSGATSIPDALRMVPGLHVAQIDANKWAISSRGFNGRFANKMLVLIDGRSVYTNLSSGVYWDQNDVLLEDVERIEVIRGPGATMWGANAVNGVINVITRSAAEAQGVLLAVGAGNADRASAVTRYGSQAGENVHYRTQLKWFNRRQGADQDGIQRPDAESMVRGGGRFDWAVSERDELSVHGDAYRGGARQMIFPNYPLSELAPAELDTVDMSGGYALGRWERHLSDRSDLAFQSSYSEERRMEEFGGGGFRTLDLDFQHRSAAGSRHDLVWGAGFRRIVDRLDKGRAPFDPDRRRDNLYGTFVQDDITLIPDALIVTLGSKFQHNAYSGFEIQPSARALWKPNHHQGVWGAISRAVRTPSRFLHDLSLDFRLPGGPLPMTGRLMGSDEVQSESVVAVEAGYRHRINQRVGIDVAVYHNDYDRLATVRR